MADLTSNIEDAGAAPKRAKTEAGEFEAHPLPDLIAGDKYLRAITAGSKKHRGLRFNRLVPPAAVGKSTDSGGD